jgi:hypothetical protein
LRLNCFYSEFECPLPKLHVRVNIFESSFISLYTIFISKQLSFLAYRE